MNETTKSSAAVTSSGPAGHLPLKGKAEEAAKPSYWAVLPAAVRYDPEIPASAKLLYAEISSLTDSRGYCWASNAYFERLYDLSERTIVRLIRALEKAGYIRILDAGGGAARRKIAAGINPLGGSMGGKEEKDLSTPLRSAQDDKEALRSAQDDKEALRSAQDDKEALRSAQDDRDGLRSAQDDEGKRIAAPACAPARNDGAGGESPSPAGAAGCAETPDKNVRAPLTKMSVPPDKNVRENKKENKKENDPPKAPQGAGADYEPKKAPDWKPDRWEKFWAFYPLHKSKQAAIKAWDKLKPSDELLAVIGHALVRQIAEKQAECTRLRIPFEWKIHASTYLNQARWTDEPPQPLRGSSPGGGTIPAADRAEEAIEWV